MLLLSCNDLSRGFQEGPLFEGLGFELFHGDRVGLVGPNGCGKSTLMRILAGRDQPDVGSHRLHAGARLAMLEQEPEFAPGTTLIEEARAALDQLVAAQHELIETSEQMARETDDVGRKRLAERYDRLNELLRHHDAYNIDHHVEEVLEGLGLPPSSYDQPVATLSGGQQRRLLIAKLLLSAPDVMLLDEPSNHLDLWATRWLEDYLIRQNEAMIIVSHDRYFLDRVVTKIYEISQGRLTVYPGNYKQYVRLREERYEREMKSWEAQREYIEKQEEYIRRVNYGQLAKQAQSRRAALDRLERVARPVRIEGPHMRFQSVRRSGDIIFDVRDLAKSYDRPLFRDLTFQVQRGQRLGIMGPNGSGKSTLLRILLGQESADQGEVKCGHLVDVGYLDQHLNTVSDDESVMHAAWPDERPDLVDQQIRDLLARFGLTGEQLDQKVGSLSGGERSRVALARLVALNVNLLVLDEPTNHLDLWACESLEEALKAFEGTVVVVSHDRYVLNRVVDLLIVLDGQGGHRVVYGNYDTYLMMEAALGKESAKEATKEKQDARPRPGKEEAKPKRKRQFPYRKVEDLEVDIALQEVEVKRLEAELTSPDLYKLGDKVKQATEAFEQSKVKLAKLYEHWEEAVELNQR